MRREIETDVTIEQKHGPHKFQSEAHGSLVVSGPRKFHEGADPHVRVGIGHEGDAIEIDGWEHPTTDWGDAGATLSMEEARQLYWALNDMLYNSEPTVLMEGTDLSEDQEE